MMHIEDGWSLKYKVFLDVTTKKKKGKRGRRR